MNRYFANFDTDIKSFYSKKHQANKNLHVLEITNSISEE